MRGFIYLICFSCISHHAHPASFLSLELLIPRYQGGWSRVSSTTSLQLQQRKLNMSMFISNQGSGLALSSLLVSIYTDGNEKHLNKKSKREWVWLLLPRAGLADPVFIKGLFEQLKANGFMLSHVQQTHDGMAT